MLTTAPGGPGTPRSPALPGSPCGERVRVEGLQWESRASQVPPVHSEWNLSLFF